ncbi:MAG: glycosyl transferase [Patescibacteria group bacterium]|nr:MAG: glycosyl transferase [Patescibacteria group bacterium]
MKVVIDARLYGLENAGLGRYLINLINEIARIKKPKFDYVVILRKKYFDSLDLPSNFKKVCLDVRHYSFSEQFLLPLFLYKENPDLVHFPHFNVPILYFGKYVVTIHDMLMHRFKGVSSTTLHPFLYFIKRIFYYFVFWKAVGFAKFIFVPSEFVGGEIGERFSFSNPKIRVIYEGVSNLFLNDFQSKKLLYKKYNLSRDYIIYCGNSYPHKNLKLVLKAIKILHIENISNFDFLIISPPNNFRHDIEKEVKKEGLENFVKFFDFIPDDDLAALMHYSTAYVFPSLAEGFGLPGLEAMASGTLLLASDIPVFREIYQDLPFYFDPHDPISLSLVLKKALKISKQERLKRISLGKMFVKKYSWQEMAKKVLSTYKEVVGFD